MYFMKYFMKPLPFQLSTLTLDLCHDTHYTLMESPYHWKLPEGSDCILLPATTTTRAPRTLFSPGIPYILLELNETSSVVCSNIYTLPLLDQITMSLGIYRPLLFHFLICFQAYDKKDWFLGSNMAHHFSIFSSFRKINKNLFRFILLPKE